MKFQETHFEEYIQSNIKENLHPKLCKFLKHIPDSKKDFKNLIFYGPPGVGKYTQMLKSILKFSANDLKYEKKININYLKQQYMFKISDIHYEIDMGLLGCNSKLLWHEIYQQIIDIIFAKTEKFGIIVCKNFHEIHSELLDNFYSYMQQNNIHGLNLNFIIITEQLSFIPDNILTCCKIINVPRPSKLLYHKCTNSSTSVNTLQKSLPLSLSLSLSINLSQTLAQDVAKSKIFPNILLENIINIKHLNCENNELIVPHKIICDKLINEMINVEELKFLKFRDLQYDAFIVNLDITECIWYIISSLLKQNKFKSDDLPKILIKTYTFLQYYNNNYRPIYHLENFLLYLTALIHGFAV
jgi:hypothetical protein